MLRVCLAASLLFLSGCISLPGPLPQEQAEKIRSIAVDSFVDNTVAWRNNGATAFTTHYSVTEVAWGLDQEFRSRLNAALSPRYEVKPLDLRKSAGLHEGLSVQQVVDALKANQPPGYVDAYLIVSSLSLGNTASHSSANVSGSTVAIQHRPFGSPIIEAYFNYVLTVVDGRTFAILGQRGAVVPSREGTSILGAPQYESPHIPLRQTLAVHDFSDLPADEKENVRLSMIAMMATTLPTVLQRLYLGNGEPIANW